VSFFNDVMHCSLAFDDKISHGGGFDVGLFFVAKLQWSVIWLISVQAAGTDNRKVLITVRLC
jgi:hypothetical protein